MDHTGAIDTEEELGPLAHLAPSPQSEAVAHEFQELSLQSSQHLPPLNERKNGECFSCMWDFDLEVTPFVGLFNSSCEWRFIICIWQSPQGTLSQRSSISLATYLFVVSLVTPLVAVLPLEGSLRLAHWVGKPTSGKALCSCWCQRSGWWTGSPPPFCHAQCIRTWLQRWWELAISVKARTPWVVLY